MKFREAAETLSKGCVRALGAVISKIHSFQEIGLKTFESLFYPYVTLVLDYCSGVGVLTISHVLIMYKIVPYVIS